MKSLKLYQHYYLDTYGQIYSTRATVHMWKSLPEGDDATNTYVGSKEVTWEYLPDGLQDLEN